MPSSAAIDEAMRACVAANEVAGVVTLVAGPDEILHLSAVGMADIAANKPMETDTLFWIASMTKPITGVAVMMMNDAGKLSIDDPVSKYLPEFKALKDPAGYPVAITIKQCLVHTSGLGEITHEERKSVPNLAAMTPMILAKPMRSAPGTKWEYNQSGINTAARIVEVVSGKTFPEFLTENLFGPLGMPDTTFYPSEEQLKRLAMSYMRFENGQLQKVTAAFLGGKLASDTNRCPMASGGLFSTAKDYARFAQMILRGGELDGVRYLRPESVRRMTTIQSGDFETAFIPGSSFGLTWCIVREPKGPSAALSPGTFGHGGMFGTQCWIDPVRKRAYILLVQRSNFAVADASNVRAVFQEAASTL